MTNILVNLSTNANILPINIEYSLHHHIRLPLGIEGPDIQTNSILIIDT